MAKDYSYDYEWDKKYCYANSNVLKNKLNITDAINLSVAEREITSLKIAQAKLESINGKFDFNHLKSIHKFIFEDIYKWAGEIRCVNIAKGNQFCNYEYIQIQADELFLKLEKEDFLKNTNQENMPYRLAYYFGELNVIHPFREGNGRTQRLFIEYLAEQNGYILNFSKVSTEEMIYASANAFACDYKEMNTMFIKIIEKMN